MPQETNTIRSAALIYISLLILLLLSYAEYRWETLPHPTVIAFTIAFVKAGLVLWYFMELREGPTLLRWTCLAGIAWVGILFGLTALT